MRRRLREAGLEVRVVKNTLLRLAANESGQPELLEIVDEALHRQLRRRAERHRGRDIDDPAIGQQSGHRLHLGRGLEQHQLHRASPLYGGPEISRFPALPPPQGGMRNIELSTWPSGY